MRLKKHPRSTNQCQYTHLNLISTQVYDYYSSYFPMVFSSQGWYFLLWSTLGIKPCRALKHKYFSFRLHRTSPPFYDPSIENHWTKLNKPKPISLAKSISFWNHQGFIILKESYPRHWLYLQLVGCCLTS